MVSNCIKLGSHNDHIMPRSLISRTSGVSVKGVCWVNPTLSRLSASFRTLPKTTEGI